MIELSSNNFKEEVLSYNDLVIVDFWAPWCGPCRFMTPILEEIEKEQKVKICKVNVDEHSDLSNQYGVTSLPTLMFFKNGSLKNQIIGGKRKEQLVEAIKAFN